MVQWLRVLLPAEGTQVRPLVREDFTYRRAIAEPLLQSPRFATKEAQAPQPERSSCSPQLEKTHAAVKTQPSRKQIIIKIFLSL